MLLSFADDHRRHLQDIHVICRARGTVVERPPPPEPRTSSFVSLGSTLASLDPKAAIENMISNEELTNGTYETALWVIADEDSLALLRRNREDERRHLDALTKWILEHVENLDV